jgi:AraC-like DNA-binding protein
MIDTGEFRAAPDATKKDLDTAVIRTHALTLATQALREAQVDLAHQPITAIVTNAQAARNFLNRRPPDLDEVRQALDCIVRDAYRASDVIDRIRGLLKDAPLKRERLEINGAIRDVLELTPSERLTQFRRLEPRLQTTIPESSFAADQQFHLVANGLAELLETARRELERDRDVAKTSLITASRILYAEIERCSGASGCSRGGLVAWQISRVRAYIDSNLHRTIHIRDLCAVARRSPAHFCRQFKSVFGETPHAYVVRRRLEKACHLMMTSATSLSEIALIAGFSDQAHLCRLFRQAFGQSPGSWRRECRIPGEVTLRTGADENFS